MGRRKRQEQETEELVYSDDEDNDNNNFTQSFTQSEESLEIESKVRDGKAALKGQFPYQVSLQYTASTSHFCGASIIHPLILLTAAHCFLPETPVHNMYRAVAGEHNFHIPENTEQTRDVIQLISHPEWNETTKDNDIAILVLDKPFEFNNYTQPIRIPKANSLLLNQAQVSGWGFVNKTVRMPEILQTATIGIRGLSECVKVYSKEYTVTDNMICAGGKSDSCQGDSGGPLTCRSPSRERFLCGIVSWGNNCDGRHKVPGLYTDVSKYHHWIVKHVHEIVKSHPYMQRRTECDRESRSYPHVTCTTCLVKDTNGGNSQVRTFVAFVQIQADIEYRYSRTQVTSVMINPSATVSDEVNFSVYLPNTAFISKFSMALNGSSYDANVEDRQTARLKYSQARKGGRTAGIVEASSLRENLFNVSATVGPKTAVTFKLTYEELLPRRMEMYEQTIHIDLEKAREAGSYEIIGTVSDYGNITMLRALGLNSTSGIDEEIEGATVVRDGNVGTISWGLDTSKPHIPQRLVLQYDIEREADTSSGGQVLIRDGYFAHFFSPSHILPFDKHFIFVLEMSGSMDRTVLRQLGEGVVYMLNGLRGKDRFSLIMFDDNPRVVLKDVGLGHVRTTRGKIMSMKGKGGSNLHGALMTALNLTSTFQSTSGAKLSPSSIKPIIVLFSTGNVKSTAGISNHTLIQSEVAAANADQQVPIYSLAYGPSPDFPFLRKISLQNNGFARKVFPESDHAGQLIQFHNEISSPLLVDLNFAYNTSSNSTFKVSDVTATSFPTYFKGSSLVVMGKLEQSTNQARNSSSHGVGCNHQSGNTSLGIGTDPGTFTATVLGRSTDRLEEFPTTHVIDCSCLLKTSSSFMERLWAYLKIKEVLQVADTMTEEQLDEIRNAGCEEPGQYAKRIALEYGFVTPVTSLVVVQPNLTDVVVELPEKNVFAVKRGTFSGPGGPRQGRMKGQTPCYAFKTKRGIQPPPNNMNTTAVGSNDTSSAVNPFGNSVLNGTLLYPNNSTSNI